MAILRVMPWVKRQLHLLGLSALARHLLQALSLISALTGRQLGVLTLIDAGPTVSILEGHLRVRVLCVVPAVVLDWQKGSLTVWQVLPLIWGLLILLVWRALVRSRLPILALIDLLATVTRVSRNNDVVTLHGLLTNRAAARLLVELAKQLAALFVAEVLKLLHLLRRQGSALRTNLGRAEQGAESKKKQGSDVAFYVFNHSLCCFRMGQRI